jgi:GTPase SAR1 family protein
VNKNELTVAMLGPSGVGKTALLAVVSRALGQTANLTDLVLKAEVEGQAKLDDHYQLLEELVKSFSTSGNSVWKGTITPQDYIFELQRKGGFLRERRESLSIKFIDVPGGNLLMRDKRDDYVDVVSKSGATIIVVDTIALMHSRGKFNEQRNLVKEVMQLVKEAYDKSANESKLLIFVPIKCETYLRGGKDPQDIHESLKSAYDDLLRGYLLPKALNIAVVVTPVKTVGCVVYNSNTIDKNGRIDWKLKKTSEDDLMEPAYVEEPIRFLLRFLFCQFLNRQNSSIFGAFNNFLGRNEDLKEAVKKFADVRTGIDVPIEILQGHHLLNLK